MAAQSPIIAGVFEQEAQARRALSALQQAGFSYDQVGVATPDQKETRLRKDLLDLGTPAESATYYEQEFNAGRTIVSVRPDGREQEAHDILHQYGGYDYEHQTLETRGDAGYTQDATAFSAQPAVDDVQDEFHQPRSLRLREERLNVSKDRVQTGEVHLHKEIITEQKTVSVPVTHEEVVVERRPVAGGQIDNATPIGEGETIRIPVSEEKVNVNKNTVVTGEVGIGKRAVQETQQVTDSVRREEARVEGEGNAKIQGDIDPQQP